MLHVCLQRGFKTGGQRAKNRQTEHRVDAARHARRNDPTRMMPRRIHLDSCLILAQHSYTLSDTAVCSCAAQKHSSANEFRGRLHCAQHLQLERRHIHTIHHTYRTSSRSACARASAPCVFGHTQSTPGTQGALSHLLAIAARCGLRQRRRG